MKVGQIIFLDICSTYSQCVSRGFCRSIMHKCTLPVHANVYTHTWSKIYSCWKIAHGCLCFIRNAHYTTLPLFSLVLWVSYSRLSRVREQYCPFILHQALHLCIAYNTALLGFYQESQNRSWLTSFSVAEFRRRNSLQCPVALCSSKSFSSSQQSLCLFNRFGHHMLSLLSLSANKTSANWLHDSHIPWVSLGPKLTTPATTGSDTLLSKPWSSRSSEHRRLISALLSGSLMCFSLRIFHSTLRTQLWETHIGHATTEWLCYLDMSECKQFNN